MRKRNIALSLAAAAAAALISSCATAAHNGAHTNLTVHCTETLAGQDVAMAASPGPATARSQGRYMTEARPLTTGCRTAKRRSSAA